MSLRAAGTWRFPTALGICRIAYSAHGVSGLQLEAPAAPPVAQAGPPPPAWVLLAARAVQRQLEGEDGGMQDVVLNLRGCPPFSRKVYRRLRRLPPGQTTSYGALARACGSPGGARAVGRAMAANPVPLLVPCHRVLAASGGLGGYSGAGGVVTKLRLLAMEGADLSGVARAGVRELGAADPLLGGVIRRVGPFRLAWQQRADHFTALAESIVHQQVSMKAGATIFGRLRALAGGGDRLSPQRVLALGPQALRGAGLSQQKAAYVLDLAARVRGGALPLARLHRLDDEAIIATLTQVKGIGRWSAQMFLIFRLGRLDVLPLDDLGLRKGAQRLYGMPALPGPAALTKLGERWRPFRSIATWYLWRSLEAGGL